MGAENYFCKLIPDFFFMLQGWIIIFSALVYNTRQGIPLLNKALFNSGQDSKSLELAAIIDHKPGPLMRFSWRCSSTSHDAGAL